MKMHLNYINGSWVEGIDIINSVSPSDASDVVGQYAVASPMHVDQAIAAARASCALWARSGVQGRFELLHKIGNEMIARKDELGRLISREEGKVLADGVGEVERAGNMLLYLAGEVVRLHGISGASIRTAVHVETLREPTGVIAAITPWNFPMASAAWKVGAALAYGNCVVLKPSEFAPSGAWALVEMLSRAGLPDGAVNLVMGPGLSVGDTLVSSRDVDGVTFTGSTRVGNEILAKASKRGAKVQLELGGKNPLVVLNDADLEAAVDCAAKGAFSQTGQRCTASSRLVVTEGIYDQFVKALRSRVSQLKVGHSLDADMDIGPVINKSQMEKDLFYIELGRKEGATLISGGEPLVRQTKGNFISPALFADASNAMRICREEIFGPVSVLIRVRDYEEALAVANDTEFGLTSGIVTTSLKFASHFRQRSQAGTVMVNLPTAGIDYHVPFGGRKASGYGSREHGGASIEFFTELKTVYTAPGL